MRRFLTILFAGALIVLVLGASISFRNFSLSRKSIWAKCQSGDTDICKELTQSGTKKDKGTAYGMLGFALMKRGDLDAAILAYKNALDYLPDDPRIYTNLGIAYMGKHDHSDAFDAVNHAITLQPTFSDAYCALGMLDYSTGKPDSGRAAFQKALSLDSNSTCVSHFRSSMHSLGVTE